MTDYSPRFFENDASIVRIGEGLLARSLPREEWTHEAHLGSCLWIVRERPDIEPERDMSHIISGYNESVGGVNDDTQGYHETITQVYIAAVRAHLLNGAHGLALFEEVNALLLSPRGQRNLPFKHYSKELLFSVAARRGFVEPDRASLEDI